MESAKELRSLVFAGLIQKQLEISDDVLDRLNHELSVIEELSLAEYFLIFSKIVGICNKEGILRSLGRGSACSSLVNYSLDIIKINPLNEGLLFERFLNPELSKWADIDIDVPIGAQKKIVEKLKMELSEYSINFIAYHPSKEPVNYQKLKINDEEYFRHPSAVIISPESLHLPTCKLKNDTYYVCDDLSDIKEKVEPFQFDILELEYLNKLDLIWKQIGEEYHPYKLKLNDWETIKIFRSSDTSDIFQFTTSFSKRMVPKFQPNNINDLAIFNTMYRPGLMDHIPELITNKNDGYEGFCKSDYRVSFLLEETYGLLIYQETFIHLAHEIAGFRYQEADTFRKILYKQNDDFRVNEFREKFSAGCKSNSSLTDDDITSLIETILAFMPKAFLKSHSISYTTISYWGAYYRAHFRSEFDTVFNTGLPQKSYIKTILQSISAMDIEILRHYLKKEYTYEEATKDVFLEKMEAIFEKHRGAGDAKLLYYPGACTSETCPNCGNRGYRFVGNQTRNYLDLLFETEGDNITDIYSCSQFSSDEELQNLGSKSIIDVGRDEKAGFIKTPSYWAKVYAAQDAYKEIITTPPRVLSKEDILYWLNKHAELNDRLGVFNPFRSKMKWSDFHGLYSDLKDIKKAIFDNEDKIIQANKERENVESEEQLVEWALKYEDVYHAGTLNLQISFEKIGEEYGFSQFDEYFFIGDVFAETQTFFVLFTREYYDLLNKYSVFTSEEDDEINKKEDWDKEDGERLKLSFHVEKRKQLEALGIKLPYFLQGKGMSDESVPF